MLVIYEQLFAFMWKLVFNLLFYDSIYIALKIYVTLVACEHLKLTKKIINCLCSFAVLTKIPMFNEPKFDNSPLFKL